MKQDELNKKLFDAVSGNRISEIEQLLKQGADVNAKTENGWTPLYCASNWNRIDIAKLLIENGADVNAQNKNGWTPLHEASYWDYVGIAKLLIENGADVNAKNKNGETPLYWASRWNQIGIAKLLIENGADVDAQNKDGWTPLHQAAFRGKIDIVKVLIENGADPFIKNINGKTALDLCEDKAIREILEKHMKEYNQTIDETKNNEYSIFNNNLLDAVFNSDLIEVKKCVFSGKYNIDVQDDKGYTPLMYAIMDHNFDIVEFLVDHGADINLCNFKGQSPLKIAYKYDDEKIASYLLEKGAIDKNLEDKKENTSNKNIW